MVVAEPVSERDPTRLSRAKTIDIEYELRHYHRSVEEYRDLIHEIASLSLGHRAADDDAPRAPAHGYDHADPTPLAAMLRRHHARLGYLERLLPVIAETHRLLPPDQRRLVELVYWQRRPAHEVCDALCISRATLHRWRRVIVATVALRLGWR